MSFNSLPPSQKLNSKGNNQNILNFKKKPPKCPSSKSYNRFMNRKLISKVNFK